MTDISCTVAIVEDEVVQRTCVELFLQNCGFTVWGAPSAEAFYRQLAAQPADVVLVDRGLPGEDGLSLIRHLHEIGRYGIIALTGCGSVADRIAGLDAGADQYFVKPVDLHELAAGIRALVRGRSRTTMPTHRAPDVGHAPWHINRMERALVSPLGQGVKLTSREMELLECLLKEPDCTVPKAHIIKTLGAPDEPEGYHRVEALISRLRKKVEQESGLALPIRSIFGKGLVFVTHGERRT